MATMTKKCAFCGVEFEARRKDHKTCSNNCRNKIHYRRHNVVLDIKICIICGEEFSPHSMGQIYCSNSCNSKAHYERNKPIIERRKKQYNINNRNKIREQQRQWRAQNREHCKQYRKSRRHLDREYWRNRRANDPMFRIKNNLRNRLNSILKKKTVSATKLVGCTWEELRTHIENQFQDGMTWDNYGEWHIDHIKPISLFNLLDTEEVKQACHYTNLQPLWAADNLKKWCTCD